jgi:hypothetical protein
MKRSIRITQQNGTGVYINVDRIVAVVDSREWTEIKVDAYEYINRGGGAARPMEFLTKSTASEVMKMIAEAHEQ